MSEFKQCLNKTEIEAPANQAEHFEKLSEEKQQRLVEWCKANFNAVKTINTSVNSYEIKEAFCTSEEGFYITNGQLKGAMVKAGFECKPTKDGINCRFNVSKASPYFKD